LGDANASVPQKLLFLVKNTFSIFDYYISILFKDLAAQLYQASAAQQLGCAVCHVHKDRLDNLSAGAIVANLASRTETRRNALGHFCE